MGSIAKKKILLVDDEPDITAPFKEGLNASGFEVDAYNDSKVALSEFVPGRYDLAIIDLRMPKINGFELCRAIKAKDGRVRLFILTAFDIRPKEFKIIFPELGVRHVIRKPVEIDELVAYINDEFKND